MKEAGEGWWSAQDEALNGACLGQGLPSLAEHHLRLAGQSYAQDKVAEGHLRAALAAAPDHIAVQIGLYRFYFYKGRLAEARAVAERCLHWAATALGLNADWRNVKERDADFGSFEAILPRFFLFSLKGYAYLQARLGNVQEGCRALRKLIEIDPADKFGARGLLQVFERQGRDDDD